MTRPTEPIKLTAQLHTGFHRELASPEWLAALTRHIEMELSRHPGYHSHQGSGVVRSQYNEERFMGPHSLCKLEFIVEVGVASPDPLFPLDHYEAWVRCRPETAVFTTVRETLDTALSRAQHKLELEAAEAKRREARQREEQAEQALRFEVEKLVRRRRNESPGMQPVFRLTIRFDRGVLSREELVFAGDAEGNIVLTIRSSSPSGDPFDEQLRVAVATTELYDAVVFALLTYDPSWGDCGLDGVDIRGSFESSELCISSFELWSPSRGTPAHLLVSAAVGFALQNSRNRDVRTELEQLSKSLQIA